MAIHWPTVVCPPPRLGWRGCPPADCDTIVDSELWASDENRKHRLPTANAPMTETLCSLPTSTVCKLTSTTCTLICLLSVSCLNILHSLCLSALCPLQAAGVGRTMPTGVFLAFHQGCPWPSSTSSSDHPISPSFSPWCTLPTSLLSLPLSHQPSAFTLYICYAYTCPYSLSITSCVFNSIHGIVGTHTLFIFQEHS